MRAGRGGAKLTIKLRDAAGDVVTTKHQVRATLAEKCARSPARGVRDCDSWVMPTSINLIKGWTRHLGHLLSPDAMPATRIALERDADVRPAASPAPRGIVPGSASGRPARRCDL